MTSVSPRSKSSLKDTHKFNRPFFFRWLYSFLIFFLIVAASSLLYNFQGITAPRYDTTDWEGYDISPAYVPPFNATESNILLDPHSHTRYSDGYLTPEQNLLWHLSLGYNAMVLTDHNTFKGIEEIRSLARTRYNDTIKVLIGTEWTTRRLHLNLILPPNATDYDHLTPPGWDPSDAQIQQIIIDTHALGGLVVVNHIPWTEEFGENQPGREEWLAWGVDYIEIINEEVYDSVSFEFCEVNGLGMVAGTDMHTPGPVYSWTLLNTSEFTEQAIFDQLVARNTALLYNETPSPYPILHNTSLPFVGLLVHPFTGLGEIFTNIFWPDVQVGLVFVWLGWFHGFFFAIEALVYFSNSRPKGKKEPISLENNVGA